MINYTKRNIIILTLIITLVIFVLVYLCFFKEKNSQNPQSSQNSLYSILVSNYFVKTPSYYTKNSQKNFLSENNLLKKSNMEKSTNFIISKNLLEGSVNNVERNNTNYSIIPKIQLINKNISILTYNNSASNILQGLIFFKNNSKELNFQNSNLKSSNSENNSKNINSENNNLQSSNLENNNSQSINSENNSQSINSQNNASNKNTSNNTSKNTSESNSNNSEATKAKEKTQSQILEENKNKTWRIQIPKINLDVHISEGVTNSVLLTSVGHFTETSKWQGNVCLAAHNRGYPVNYFARVKELKKGDEIYYTYKGEEKTYIVDITENLEIGDKIIYTTLNNKKVYKVQTNKVILETDWSYLQTTKDNRITLITCEENRKDCRRCVQAVEVANYIN